MDKRKGKQPEISESEWKIMRVLWKRSPLPAYDIIEAVGPSEGWHPNTIKTLLSRLHKKKVLGVKKYKNLFLYSPLVTEEECVQAESESFLERLFDGSVRPLLVHFARQKKLTKADLEELRKILEEKGK